jgi:hypothetical protein
MTRRINIIQVFFLFLAAAVFNAHMLIPHDHHLIDSGSCQDNSFTSHKTASSHHPVFPSHCHAFNDLTSDKAVDGLVLKYIQVSYFMPGSVLNSEPPEKLILLILVPENSGKPEHAGSSFSFSRRAPPSLA